MYFSLGPTVRANIEARLIPQKIYAGRVYEPVRSYSWPIHKGPKAIPRLNALLKVPEIVPMYLIPKQRALIIGISVLKAVPPIARGKINNTAKLFGALNSTIVSIINGAKNAIDPANNSNGFVGSLAPK